MCQRTVSGYSKAKAKQEPEPRLELQHTDNPLSIAMQGIDVKMRRVKSKIPTVWAGGGLRYL